MRRTDGGRSSEGARIYIPGILVESTPRRAYRHAVATGSTEMLAQVEAGSHIDRAAPVDVLMQRWIDAADHAYLR